MKLKRFAVCATAFLWAGGLGGAALTTAPADAASLIRTEPLMLDLSPFFWERFVTPERTNMELVTVSGRQVFDGLPFQVDGRACLYGRALAANRGRPASAYPDIIGVKVGRPFDELHLLHATQFTDREGETVANVRLNYADGSRHEFPITYGGQVRDWQRLQSEEREIYTDPDTKVIWRGPGVARFKSTTRMSKTRLVNPFPRKAVSTIDFVSTDRFASYDVAAATVASRDPSRPITPPVPLDRPERDFDGTLTVSVVDEAGQPIEGVLVSPNISVAGSYCATVATPLYTTADGLGTVRYPKHESACMYFWAAKDGWTRLPDDPWFRFRQPGVPTNGIVITIRMAREPTAVVARGPAEGKTATATNTLVAAGSEHRASGGGVQDPRPHPILIIDCPVGANVGVEYADNLTQPVWKLLTVITNVPSSPYAYVCGREPGGGPQRFYRVACSP
jgi:hypothetical protein